jgi:hypothetical protein
MMLALAIPLARPVDVESQGTIREGWVSRLAAAFLSLFRANAPSVRDRLLARMRTPRAAVGFPFRTTPEPPPTKRDRNCDCVPMGW